MGKSNNIELTDEEAALYDRQIRLWGLESQKRLRTSRILLSGLNGLGAEIAKNIILAGVKSVTLLDGDDVTEEDKCSQFLAAHDQIGKNRAEASLQRAKALNPMVEVTADPTSLETKDSDFFNKFDVVIILKEKVDKLIEINEICRKKNIKFFCGDVWGMFGYSFADLQAHDFVEDVLSFKMAPSVQPGEKAKSVSISTPTKRSLTFVSLRKALDSDLATPQRLKRFKRNGPSFAAMRVLQGFRDAHGRDPRPDTKEDDTLKLDALRQTLLQQNSLDACLFPPEFFVHVFAQVSPVCAIVGGVLAQEVIKAVSQKEPPHDNFFFFDPYICTGVVECVH